MLPLCIEISPIFISIANFELVLHFQNISENFLGKIKVLIFFSYNKLELYIGYSNVKANNKLLLGNLF